MAGPLAGVWSGEALPLELAELIDDAERALELARVVVDGGERTD